MEDIEKLGKLILEFNQLNKANLLWAKEKGLPPFEVAHQFIINAIGVVLSNSTDRLIAGEVIAQCVVNGLKFYRENSASEDSND